MTYVYTKTMLFTGYEEDEGLGWTTDCGGKKDYDPVIVRISSRVWRDGTYTQSVIVGGDTYVHNTGILEATSASEARAIVEREAAAHAKRIICAVKAAYEDSHYV